MATYAIGDIQGCYDALRRLLDRIDPDPAKDKLWFVGDLVNRGPDSLAVLRFVKGLGNQAIVVLGNHDLHLLARAEGHNRNAKKDNLDDILKAPDRDVLLHWLRHRPLAHYDPKKEFLMIHAGVPPQWDLAQTLACARELETALREHGYQGFLTAMYGDQPSLWSDGLVGMDRLRFITNCLTRMRYCDAAGRLNLTAKGPVGSQPAGYLPWFQVPNRASRGVRMVFGHWSALGWYAGDNVWCLDSGCLWGGQISALRLRRKGPCEAIRLDCPSYRRPKGSPPDETQTPGSSQGPGEPRFTGSSRTKLRS
jgi:bis(5'-nucleosyl)-tetraphosphatase (symmetrical)